MNKLNEEIQNLYKKSGYFDRYGGDIILAICIIAVVSYLFMYLTILNNIQPIKKNWAKERCNPFYMPFAGWINNDSKNMSNFQYTLNNFNSCIQSMSKEMAQYSLDPISYLINVVVMVLASIGELFTGLLSLFTSIINGSKEFMTIIENLVLNVVVKIIEIVIKMRDTFGKLVGTLVTTMFFQIVNLQFGAIWLIWTPVYTISTFLFPIMVNIVTATLYILYLAWSLWGFSGGVTAGLIGCAALPVLTMLETNPFTFVEASAALPADIAACDGLIPSEVGVTKTTASLIKWTIWLAFNTLISIPLWYYEVQAIHFTNRVLGDIKIQGLPTFPI